MLNKVFSLRDSGCSNGVETAQMPRHRWYVMKESFSPRLVSRALEEVEGEGLILDPFSGSGTVALAAQSSGHVGVGVEVNPFLAFVGRVKMTHIQALELERHQTWVFNGAKKGAYSSLERYSTFSSQGGAEKWLFNRCILQAFEGGWKATSDMSANVRDAFRLALIGAAMDCCNAVPDGKCLRYRKDWQQNPFRRHDFLEALERRLATICEDLPHDPCKNGHGRIFEGDSRKGFDFCLAGRKFDLCVTSPPYLNSFDYSDVYRPELFLGKHVKSTTELRSIRLRTLRSHIQVDWERPQRGDFGELYARQMKRLSSRRNRLWNPKLPIMVQAYFEDMSAVLRGLRASAHDHSSLWLVVSTSAYGGVELPVDLILADIGSQVGWRLREVGVLRHLRSSGQHWSERSQARPPLRESVVIFDAATSHRRGW